MSLVKFERNKFLGITPKNINDENILDYFLYVFEFAWISPAFELQSKNIRGYFENKLNKITNTCQLPIEKKWWCLVLIALKDVAEKQGFIYLKETIIFLLNKISNLNIDDLENYCNDLAFSLVDETSEILSVRPIEAKKLKSDAFNDDTVMNFFITNKEAFIKIFSKNLNQKDIDKDYISSFSVNQKYTSLKFATFWEIYFEIFMGYFLSMCVLSELYKEENVKTKNINKEKFIKEIVIVFLTNSVQNKLKVNKLNEDVINLINPSISIFTQNNEDLLF